ncbi:MAG: CBS domain-containing protein [Lewinellaceae bacterium]|nr:CBS domain-containing protein [Lewinellaceae bacterium]
MKAHVEDLMSTQLITATLEHSVAQLRVMMTRHKIGALPITDLGEDPQVLGIVTDTDLRNVRDTSLPAATVMSPIIQSISPRSTIAAAANLMLQYNIHHLLVKEGDQVVGILSSLDLLRTIANNRQPLASRLLSL